MIGVLGGSFDPVHRAHLALADAFASALSLDELRFLPAARPWQKLGLAASGAQRVAMLEAMLADHRPPHGRYVVDAREIEQAGSSFTVDTLGDLRRELGNDASIVFLFGADQLVHLDTWHDWTKLWTLAHLAAAARPGFELASASSAVTQAWSSRLAAPPILRATPAGHSWTLTDFAHDVSATGIRAALAADGADDPALSRLVPAAVLDYIRANRLYRS